MSSNYTVITAISTKIQTKEMLDELGNVYQMSRSAVVSMLINQEYERIQSNVSDYVQTKLHIANLESRRAYSEAINAIGEKYGYELNKIRLNDEDDLVCPEGRGCKVCSTRYRREYTQDKRFGRVKRVVGVKR